MAPVSAMAVGDGRDITGSCCDSLGGTTVGGCVDIEVVSLRVPTVPRSQWLSQ